MIKALLGGLLFVTGCQQTNQQAIDAAKPAWAKVRAELPGLAKLIGAPMEGRLEGMSWVELSPEKTNVSFLTLEQLGDPDAKASEDGLDLYQGGNFHACLRWTGPRCPMGATNLKERSGDKLRDECAAALNTQYLVVLETTASTPPVMTGEGTFAGGQATVRVSVIDRLVARVLATFIVEGVPGQVVRYTVRPDEEKAARLATAVHSTMWSNARQQIFDKLRALGATLTPR